jgi:hypothetical protein
MKRAKNFLVERLDEIDTNTESPEDIIKGMPELGIALHRALKDMVSLNGESVYRTGQQTRSELTQHNSLYTSDYMLRGGIDPDVVSIQIYNNPEGKSASSGHYSPYDVAHVRVKVRKAIEKQGNDFVEKTYLAVEEFQSDWTTAWKVSQLDSDELRDWIDAHGETFIKVLKWINKDADFAQPNLPISNINTLLDDVNDTASSLASHRNQRKVSALLESGEMTTGMTLGRLKKDDPALAKEWGSIVTKYKQIKKTWPSNLWIQSWYKLALSSMVAYARDAGFDGLAWPEGSEVARLYNTTALANMTESYRVRLSTYEVFDQNKNTGATANNQTIHYNTDYLIGMVQTMAPHLKAHNIPPILDGIKFLEMFKENPEDAVDFANEKDSLEVVLSDDPNQTSLDSQSELIIKLPKAISFNGVLHKRLYNVMLPSAGKSLANDSSKLAREGKQSYDLVFIPDAFNHKRRPNSSGTGTGDVEDRYNERGRDLEDVITPEDLPHMADAERSEFQLFGAVGGRFRHLLYKHHHRGSVVSSSYRSEGIYAYPPSHPMLGDEFVDGFEQQVLFKSDMAYTALDSDAMAPWNHIVTLRVENMEGDLVDIEMPYMNSSTHMNSIGDTTGNVGINRQPAFDERYNTHTASFYNFAYQVMKKVWMIENPNVFALGSHGLQEIYGQFYKALNRGPNTEGPLRRPMIYGRVATAAQDAYKSARSNNPNLFTMSETAENFPVLYRGDEPNPDVAGKYDVLDTTIELVPTDKFLKWLQDNAVIKTRFDAAAARVIQRETDEGRAERDRLDFIIGGEGDLPMGREEAWRFAPKQLHDLARGVPAAESGAVEEEGEEIVDPRINPKYVEQVWHGLKFTEKVMTKNLMVPYSLRRNHDSELSIINKKINRARSEWTMADRVSNWLREMIDAVKVGDWWWTLKQGLLDEGAAVKRWEREIFGGELDASASPYKMLNMTRNLPSVMAAIAKAGIPQMTNGAFQPVEGRKGFIEILRPLHDHKDGNLVRLWEGYAAARRANELIQQENQDGTAREKLFTQGEIDELLALGDQYPEFGEVFEDWQNFNGQLLDLAVSRGVLSERERDIWSQNDYVPFYRAMESIDGVDQRAGFGRIKRGVAGQKHGIHRLYGSEKDLGNIIENMWFNTASLIDKVYKNEAMVRITDAFDGIAMKKVPMAVEMIRVTNDQLANALGKAGLLTGSHRTQTARNINRIIEAQGSSITPNGWLKAVEKMTPDQRMAWSAVFRRVAPRADNIVSVSRNGKLEYYEVEDKLLLSSLQGMQEEGLVGLMNAMGISKSVLTKMITIDPAFMLANWMRDTLSAWVTSDANFTPVVGSIKAMKDIWQENENFLKMMMSGAGGGGFYDLSGGKVAKVLNEELGSGAKTWLPKLWRGYMKVGAMSENSNRIAIAKRVRDGGGTVAEGMYQSMDIMNFTMSGDFPIMKFLIRTVPFLNARLQGLYRLGRGAKEHPIGFMIKGLSLSMATLALLARNWDDPDYEQLEGWQKDLNWNFLKDGTLYTIPRPFEVGLIFATFPERFVRALADRDDLSVTKERFYAAIGETLAFNPIPQMFKPLYEQGANINLFTGRPIVNMAMSGLEHPYQYSPWTSEAAKRIGSVVPEALGPAASPVRIQHLIRAYTGTVGLYIMNATDWALRQVAGDDIPAVPSDKWYEKPILNRVIKGDIESSRYNKYTERLYKAINASNAAFRTINAEVKSCFRNAKGCLGLTGTP